MNIAHNPLNLALRFVLEITGLAALGYWGWNLDEREDQMLRYFAGQEAGQT